MPAARTRDKVWNYALTKTVKAESSLTQDEAVEKTGASRRTVVETLNVMAEWDYLERRAETDGSVTYVVGSALR